MSEQAQKLIGIDNLPPIGVIDGSPDASALVLRCQQLAYQTLPEREPFELMAAHGRNIYAYGEREPSHEDEFVANWIQGNILGSRTIEPPRPTLECGRVRYPTEYWWIGPADAAVSIGLQPQQASEWIDEAGEVCAPQPLQHQQAEQILKMGAAGIPINGVQIDEDWITTIDADSTRDFWQTVFDGKWDEEEVWHDEDVIDADLAAGIDGWALLPLDWDDDLKRVLVRDISVRQVYCDIKRRVKQMGWIGYDLNPSVYEALNLWPDLADEINQYARAGTVPTILDQNTKWGQTENIIHYEPTVTMRIFYMRNQWVPMNADEAVSKGLLQQRTVPDEQTSQIDADSNQESDTTSQGNGQGSMQASGANQGVAGTQTQPIPTRTAYTLPDSDEELPEPSRDEENNLIVHPAWPRKRVIRETTFFQNHVVRDRVCPWPFLPFAHNVNIPVPQRPYGFGEPYRQYCLQHADNKCLASVARSVERFSEVREDIPASVAASMSDEDRRGEWGGTFEWDDDLYRSTLALTGGKMTTVTPPPPIPDAGLKLHDILTDLSNRIGGHPEVQQGETPPGVTANAAIQSLQATASQLSEWKRAGLNQFVAQLGMMVHFCDIWMLDVPDLVKIAGNYPPHVIERFRDWGQAIQWKIRVDAAGKDHMTNLEQQEVRANFQAGLITKEGAQAKLGIDAHQNQIQEQAQMEQAQMQQQALAQGQMVARATQGPRIQPAP